AIMVDRDVAGHMDGKFLNRVGLQLHALGGVRGDPISDMIFPNGAELTNGQPTKSSCQSARYFSRSLALTYSQYAFSKFQTCASFFAESCAKVVAASRTRNGMDFNMPPIILIAGDENEHSSVATVGHMHGRLCARPGENI